MECFPVIRSEHAALSKRRVTTVCRSGCQRCSRGHRWLSLWLNTPRDEVDGGHGVYGYCYTDTRVWRLLWQRAAQRSNFRHKFAQRNLQQVDAMSKRLENVPKICDLIAAMSSAPPKYCVPFGLLWNPEFASGQNQQNGALRKMQEFLKPQNTLGRFLYEFQCLIKNENKSSLECERKDFRKMLKFRITQIRNITCKTILPDTDSISSGPLFCQELSILFQGDLRKSYRKMFINTL